MRSHVVIGVLAVAVAGSLLLAPLARAPATPRQGAYVDQLTWFVQENQAQALVDLEAGTMDMYVFQLRTITDINAAKGNTNLNTLDTDGSLNNMLFNPCTVDQSVHPGLMNPFAIREVREAMNYILDRNFIANEIFGGAAFPHTTVYWPKTPDYAREAVFMSQLEQKYAFTPELGAQMIDDAMTAAGATKVSGKWMYSGNPININLVQRTEDARFEIGSYVAGVLRSQGFDVTLIPRTGGGAFAIVYNGPCRVASGGLTGPWNAYTEGWAATTLEAWDDGSPYDFYNGGEGSALWNDYDPGSFPAGTPENQMNDTSTRLFEANYASLAERQQLIQQATDLALQNSVRVWLITGATFATSTRVKGFIYDLSGGHWGFHAVRTARFAAAGGNLQIGQRIMFLSTWNPWRGFTWLYDGLQIFAFYDMAIWPHPHTGLYVPIRANFAVQTNGPTGKLDVPDAAVIWSNTAPAGFVTVSPSVQATSKATFDFNFGKWHHGQDINMNDVLQELALWGRFAAPGALSPSDPGGDVYAQDQDAQNPSVLLFNQIVRGINVVDADTIEVYGDYWHPDESSIAATLGGVTCGGTGCSGIFPVIPWEVSELSMDPVLAGTHDISEDSAAAAGVDALDLTKGTSVIALDTALPTYMATNRKPVGAGTGPFQISDAEATARWAALDTFSSTTTTVVQSSPLYTGGHFLVSNGPFFLDTINVDNSQTIMPAVNVANIGHDYPFTSDYWDADLVPKIPAVQILPSSGIALGEWANFTALTTVGGAPYDLVTMSWALVEPSSGDTLLQGNATKIGLGTWQISLNASVTDDLNPGAYTLKTVTVGQEAAIPVFATQSVVAVLGFALFEFLVAEQTAELQTGINDLKDANTALQNQVNTLSADLRNAQGLSGSLTIGIVVAVLVAVVAIVLGFWQMSGIKKQLAQMGPTPPSPPSIGGEPPKT